MSNFKQHPKIIHLSKTVSQLGLLVLIWWIGALIQKGFNLPISSGVIGLLLLLIALLSGLFKLEWIKQGSDLMLAELVLFFIPCVVGLVKYKHLFLTQGWQLVVSVVIGTLFVLVVTAYAVHLGFKFEARLKQKRNPSDTPASSNNKIIHGK